jgi:hypothetical protein
MPLASSALSAPQIEFIASSWGPVYSTDRFFSHDHHRRQGLCLHNPSLLLVSRLWGRAGAEQMCDLSLSIPEPSSPVAGFLEAPGSSWDLRLELGQGLPWDWGLFAFMQRLLIEGYLMEVQVPQSRLSSVTFTNVHSWVTSLSKREHFQHLTGACAPSWK